MYDLRKLQEAKEAAEAEMGRIHERMIDLNARFPSPAPEPMEAAKKRLADAEEACRQARNWAVEELNRQARKDQGLDG